MVFNRSEARSQKNRQLSGCTWNLIIKVETKQYKTTPSNCDWHIENS